MHDLNKNRKYLYFFLSMQHISGQALVWLSPPLEGRKTYRNKVQTSPSSACDSCWRLSKFPSFNLETYVMFFFFARNWLSTWKRLEKTSAAVSALETCVVSAFDARIVLHTQNFMLMWFFCNIYGREKNRRKNFPLIIY